MIDLSVSGKRIQQRGECRLHHLIGPWVWSSPHARLFFRSDPSADDPESGRACPAGDVPRVPWNLASATELLVE